jgi:hypothetical protein
LAPILFLSLLLSGHEEHPLPLFAIDFRAAADSAGLVFIEVDDVDTPLLGEDIGSILGFRFFFQ